MIPKHATLIYDMELISYSKNDDITEEKDGSVRKSVTIKPKRAPGQTEDYYPNKRCDIDYSYELEVPGYSKEERLKTPRVRVPGDDDADESEDDAFDADDMDWGDEADLFAELLDGCDDDAADDDVETVAPEPGRPSESTPSEPAAATPRRDGHEWWDRRGRAIQNKTFELPPAAAAAEKRLLNCESPLLAGAKRNIRDRKLGKQFGLEMLKSLDVNICLTSKTFLTSTICLTSTNLLTSNFVLTSKIC